MNPLGNVIFMDFFCSQKNQTSQVCRTVSMGLANIF